MSCVVISVHVRHDLITTAHGMTGLSARPINRELQSAVLLGRALVPAYPSFLDAHMPLLDAP